MAGSSTSSQIGAPQRGAFWRRLVDNFFRRWLWFLLPVVLLVAFGVWQANGTEERYRSTGTLSAITNPLVPEQQTSGVSPQVWETPAAATSRIINERLQTDSFLLAATERTGLEDAIAEGTVKLEDVRSAVWASAHGDAILAVYAEWGDPQTSQQLASATIEQYQRFLNNTMASDASEAERFYLEQLAGQEQLRDELLVELEEYVASLPEVDNELARPVSAQVVLDRLEAQVAAVDRQIVETQQEIDAARLTQVQETSEAGRSLTVIDAPQVPREPESSLFERIMYVAGFAFLGMIIVAAALLFTTLLDRTVASPADLYGFPGVELVTTVPAVRFAGPPGGRRRSRRRKKEAT